MNIEEIRGYLNNRVHPVKPDGYVGRCPVCANLLQVIIQAIQFTFCLILINLIHKRFEKIALSGHWEV